MSDFPPPSSVAPESAPLELALCDDCHLLQLRHTVSAETMYRNYWYRSGTNATMRAALADICRTAERTIRLCPGDSVLDIGCNDGTLLAQYLTPKTFKIGFDPAKNLEQYSKERVDALVVDFFSASRFAGDSRLRSRRPRIVTSIAMFYDLDDPCTFVSGVKEVMDPDGVWIIQMSYLPLMLEQNAFDNVCHEHLEYYSLASLSRLLSRFDLCVVDAELNDVNGGSIRAYVRNKNAREGAFGDPTYRALAQGRVEYLLARETELGLARVQCYEEFAWRVERIKSLVVDFIRAEVTDRKRVYVYGASTKGNTLLQYFGLDSGVITAAAERNSDKWGRVTVGTNIPIISEEQARAEQPDYFLVLPWHFIKEFKHREVAFLRNGGKLILPLPEFTII